MCRLTSQLGVTARWPHPSTELEPIIPAEKKRLHRSSAQVQFYNTNHSLFLSKTFPHCWQCVQFQADSHLKVHGIDRQRLPDGQFYQHIACLSLLFLPPPPPSPLLISLCGISGCFLSLICVGP